MHDHMAQVPGEGDILGIVRVGIVRHRIQQFEADVLIHAIMAQILHVIGHLVGQAHQVFGRTAVDELIQ